MMENSIEVAHGVDEEREREKEKAGTYVVEAILPCTLRSILKMVVSLININERFDAKEIDALGWEI